MQHARQCIIVFNAGSSSLKFSVFDTTDSVLELIARGQVSGMRSNPRFSAHPPPGSPPVDEPIPSDGNGISHQRAFEHVTGWLQKRFPDQHEPVAIGHRIVHGGERLISPTRIDAAVLNELDRLVPLVPLHQPHNLALVRAVAEMLPELPQVACFDTAFHQVRERMVTQFAIPREWFDQGVRRWGFHGLSYESIASQLPSVAPHLASARVVVAHLGSGASLCAMRDGRSIDTTMSFSALDGLPMGTRCGSIDPGVILHLLRLGWTGAQIEDLLYNKSGLLGLSGESNDVRALLASGSAEAQQAIEHFTYRIAREIASIASALGGLDALVFTAGIGENSPPIRAAVCARLKWLGVDLDDTLNAQNHGRISTESSRGEVWVIPTDEERVIATHTWRVVNG